MRNRNRNGRQAKAALPEIKAASGNGGNGLTWSRPSDMPYHVSQETLERKWRPRLNRDVTGMITGYLQDEMVSDARHIYGSMGQVSGAVDEKANFVSGGWVPSYNGPDIAFKEAFQEVIGKSWYRNCDVRGGPFDFEHDVWLASVRLDVDGDFFIILTTSEFGAPRLQPIEAHRVWSPWGTYQVPDHASLTPEMRQWIGAKICNGIVYDEFMREIAYNVTQGEADRWTARQWNLLPASSVLHVWDPKWFSQGRGIPAISAGILDWYDINSIRDATKAKVYAAARLSLLEYNETGKANIGPALMAANGVAANADLTHKLLQDGTIRYFRANSGHKLEQFESNQPSETQGIFLDNIARSAHKGLGWPIEMHDLSKLGGAAVRGFVSQIKRTVKRRQNVLWIPFLSAVLYATSRYIKAGRLPKTNDWYNITFGLPPEFSVDTGNDSSNRRQDVAMGIKSLTDVFEEQAEGDPRAVFEKRASLWKLRDEVAAQYGVPPEALYNPASASQPALMSLAEDQSPVQP